MAFGLGDTLEDEKRSPEKIDRPWVLETRHFGGERFSEDSSPALLL